MINDKNGQIAPTLESEGSNLLLPETRSVNESVSRVIDQTKQPKTLKDYLSELESSKGSLDNIKKLRQIQLVIMMVGEKIEFKEEDVGLITLPGNQVGEAYESEGKVVIDPVILNKDDLSLFKHALLHELTHLTVANEGLTELRTMALTGDEASDYDNLVSNVSQVTSILSGDQKSGILRAVELYSNEQYDQLFSEFENAYNKKNPDIYAKNPDAAFNIFQLAFPELKVTQGGKLDIGIEQLSD